MWCYHALIYGKKIKYYNDKEFTRRARFRAPAKPNRCSRVMGPRPETETSTSSTGKPKDVPDTPLLSPVRGRSETPELTGLDRETVDPPAVILPPRESHRSWRRRTALTVGQERDVTDEDHR